MQLHNALENLCNAGGQLSIGWQGRRAQPLGVLRGLPILPGVERMGSWPKLGLDVAVLNAQAGSCQIDAILNLLGVVLTMAPVKHGASRARKA